MTAFDKVAGVYDAMYRDRRSVAENAVLRRYVEALRGLRLLDVGCGTGLVLDLLGGFGWSEFYVGMDVSEEMLNLAQEKHPYAWFRQHDMCVPYEADVEAITSFFALNYVGGMSAAYQAVANMRTILPEDGYVMAVVAGPRRAQEAIIPPADVFFTVEDCYGMFSAFRDVEVRGLSIMTPWLPGALPQRAFNAVAEWEHRLISRHVPECGYFMIVTGRG